MCTWDAHIVSKTKTETKQKTVLTQAEMSYTNLTKMFFPFYFYFFNFLFYIGVQLINNVVLSSGVQQSDSIICIHESILFQILFPFRLLHNIEQSSLCYTVGPCWLSILNIVVCTCQSLLFLEINSIAMIQTHSCSTFIQCASETLRALREEITM